MRDSCSRSGDPEPGFRTPLTHACGEGRDSCSMRVVNARRRRSQAHGAGPGTIGAATWRLRRPCREGHAVRRFRSLGDSERRHSGWRCCYCCWRSR